MHIATAVDGTVLESTSTDEAETESWRVSVWARPSLEHARASQAGLLYNPCEHSNGRHTSQERVQPAELCGIRAQGSCSGWRACLWCRDGQDGSAAAVPADDRYRADPGARPHSSYGRHSPNIPADPCQRRQQYP